MMGQEWADSSASIRYLRLGGRTWGVARTDIQPVFFERERRSGIRGSRTQSVGWPAGSPRSGIAQAVAVDLVGLNFLLSLPSQFYSTQHDRLLGALQSVSKLLHRLPIPPDQRILNVA